MAYRPTNDTTENVIHRNTIFDSQGMVSCCTCGYCIKKTQDATLELTNFKAAPPIINEQSIGSGVLEFSDYMIPSGSSGNYILSPQSIQQNLNIESLSDGFIYYPFLNCKGTTSVSLDDPSWGLSVIENGAITKPVKTYGVEVQSTYFRWPWQPQITPLPPFSRTRSSFGGTSYYSQSFGPDGLNRYDWVWITTTTTTVPFPNYPDCTQEQVDAYAAANNISTTPVYPSTIVNSGYLDNYFSYINNNDWSIEGFRANASCSNNVVSLMAPAYFLDVSSYQFSYQYPNYSFYSSEKFIYSGPSPEGEPIPNSSSFGYITPTMWAFDELNKKMFNIYKGGYVLKDFTIDKYGKFSSQLSMIPIYELQYKTFTSHLFNNPFVTVDRFDGFSPSCYCKNYEWRIDPDGTVEETLNQFSYSSIGSAQAYGNVVSSIYGDNQELIDYRLNGYFSEFLLPYGNLSIPSQVTDVSFGANKFPSIYDPSGYTYVIDQPYVPLKYIASKTDRTQITSTTDASGRTTLTIRNILWTGKTLLTNNYSHNLGINAPRLANGKFIPQAYQAVLKGGFESDAIISFQSIPLCQTKNIADSLRKVSELKVHFENYQKIPQIYMANYDATLQFYYATPALKDISIFGTFWYWWQFYLGFSAFSDTRVSDGGGNYAYSAREFINIEFYPPNINPNNEFRIRNKYNSATSNLNNIYDFSVIPKNIIPIDPPVLTSYVAKSGRAYPDFGVADRFKSCLLINGDKDVWKTGNEVQFVGLDYLVTNGGSGYTSVPTVTLSNGGGTLATAKATISGGKVVAVTVVNKGKNYTSNKTVVISGGGGNGATAVDISFTPFYSIYMEEIKDEKQTAGQSLIRIARTLQDANNGIYIPNVGLETLYKDKSLSVKFLYGFKDVSKENLPRYENVNFNDAILSNVNADIIGGSYSKVNEWKPNFNGELSFSFISNSFGSSYNLDIRYKNKETGAAIYSYDYSYYNYPDPYAQSRYFLEVIQLSPLKLKFHGLKFDISQGGSVPLSQQAWQLVYGDAGIPRVNVSALLPFSYEVSNFSSFTLPGFQCDVIIEEVVDEFIQEALPVEFNQILENVEYIQTSNLMNSRTPMQMINPEQCEHIGKVIDRKDCNCPKQWVRLCDVHGKTDWKKCMQCKDFRVSE